MSNAETEAFTRQSRAVDAVERDITVILDASSDPDERSEEIAPHRESYPRDWSRCHHCAVIYPLGQPHRC